MSKEKDLTNDNILKIQNNQQSDKIQEKLLNMFNDKRELKLKSIQKLLKIKQSNTEFVKLNLSINKILCIENQDDKYTQVKNILSDLKSEINFQKFIIQLISINTKYLTQLNNFRLNEQLNNNDCATHQKLIQESEQKLILEFHNYQSIRINTNYKQNWINTIQLIKSKIFIECQFGNKSVSYLEKNQCNTQVKFVQNNILNLKINITANIYQSINNISIKFYQNESNKPQNTLNIQYLDNRLYFNYILYDYLNQIKLNLSKDQIELFLIKNLEQIEMVQNIISNKVNQFELDQLQAILDLNVLYEMSKPKHFEQINTIFKNHHSVLIENQLNHNYFQNHYKSTLKELYDNELSKLDFESIVFKKLLQSIPVNSIEKTQIINNINSFNIKLFNKSKTKQFKVFNEIKYKCCEEFSIANCKMKSTYLMTKNQLLIECQNPDCGQSIQDFLIRHFLTLTTNNLSVIIVILLFEIQFIKDNHLNISKFISKNKIQKIEQSIKYYLTNYKQFSNLLYSYNSVELVKVITIYGMFSEYNAIFQNFFDFIYENLFQFQSDLVYKEMLLVLSLHSNTLQMDKLIQKMSLNLPSFFENVFGYKIIKSVQDIHAHSKQYPLFYDTIKQQLPQIMVTKQLNNLQFYFLEQELYPEFDIQVLENTDVEGMYLLERVLNSNIGYSSIIALVNKYGVSAITPKFNLILNDSKFKKINKTIQKLYRKFNIQQ